MTRWFSARTAALLALCAVVMAGCGGSDPAPAPTPAPKPPAVAPAPEPAPAPVALPEDPVHRKLVGTQWTLGDLKVTFLDRDRLRVEGGDVSPHAPGGITVKYAYTDGKVEANVMGQAIAAAWDGAALSVNGLPATAVNPGAPEGTAANDKETPTP
ncbi:MAG: hypothetical protein GXY15_14905 [Candidatus Hydrogenedentes bacterium]|nr:hypothetical protein [Candidatus Hydrogenedentota bacterium]